MNDGSLNTIRKYIEFNAKENPHSDFVTCSHTNHKISNIQLKINLDKINFNDQAKNDFLKGAKIAYETIITSFAKGDKTTLKPLLNKEIYQNL